MDKGFNRVNKDEIRYMINNYKLNNADEKLVHDIQSDVIRDFIEHGRNFVVDNTHTKEKYVKELKELIKGYSESWTEYDYEIKVEVIDTPLDECLRRNALRPEPVFEEVIRRMHRQLFPNLY